MVWISRNLLLLLFTCYLVSSANVWPLANIVAVVGVRAAAADDFLIDQLLFWFRIIQCLLKINKIILILLLFFLFIKGEVFIYGCVITSMPLWEREFRVIEIRLASCKASCIRVINTEHSACFRERDCLHRQSSLSAE